MLHEFCTLREILLNLQISWREEQDRARFPEFSSTSRSENFGNRSGESANTLLHQIQGDKNYTQLVFVSGKAFKPRTDTLVEVGTCNLKPKQRRIAYL